MSIPPLTVRPIVHTEHLREWLAIFRALDARTLTGDPMWTELELDLGRVTLSGLHPGASEGEVSLGFETPDLQAYADAVVPMDGMTVEWLTTDDGTSLRVVGRDGLTFLIDERIPGEPRPARPAAWVHALWISTDVAATAQDLEALGLRTRITNVNGRTIDLRAAEGDVLVHVDDGGPIGADVAVDVADLDAAHKALIDAGIGHDVIDETHGRTLRVPRPGGAGSELWVAQEDEDPVGVVKHF
ncbi:hypothetical protein [Nocardioides sp. KR10-350]|uniref:hypothetical protein n=1 Tax=Nocardioides cheoyonin TaxID=3156615 RepID=UPI0032B5E5B7